MKKVMLAACFMALLGCHSRDDGGPFRTDLATIAPADSGLLRQVIYRKPILLTSDDGLKTFPMIGAFLRHSPSTMRVRFGW